MQTETELREMTEILNALAEMRRFPVLTKTALTIWFNAMRPFSLESFKAAVQNHILDADKGAFMPQPSDLIRYLEGTTQDHANLAWTKLELAVRRVGTYASVVFDDSLIHRVVADMGGWQPFGLKEEKDWPFTRNEFVARYRAYAQRREEPEYPPVLVGIFESQNSIEDKLYVEEPTLIGDPKRCAIVMRGGTKAALIQITGPDEQQPKRARLPALAPR